VPDADVHFQATYTPMMHRKTASSLKVYPFMRSRKVLSAKTLSDAVRGCDTYARSKVVFGPMAIGCVLPCLFQYFYNCHRLLRTARWRKAQATANQKTFISKRLIKRQPLREPPVDGTFLSSQDKIETLTKGQAANIITRLKHGAQVRLCQC
jgi:ATP-dependent helicase IRC3